MEAIAIVQKMLAKLSIGFALAVASPLATGVGPAAAQTIVGVWRATEGTPSGFTPWVTASDVQTLTLTQDGRYQREIVVEGGNGYYGAGGKIIDSGQYRFTPPQTLEYRRRSWIVCTALACNPGQPIGPNTGTLPFRLIGGNQASFLQLTWTRIQ